MNDKPRTGRPAFNDGFQRFTISLRGTRAEFDAVLDGLPSRGRMEALLEAVAAQAADDLWQPFEDAKE